MDDEKRNDLELEKKEARIDFLWTLAERIADRLRGDSRVESIWVCGSLARGEADEFSDLDMAALIEKGRFSGFMQESRKEKWLSLGAEGWMDKWGDKYVIRGVPFHIDYLTLDRILGCDWDELEHAEWLLGGIAYSKALYDPKGALKRLKEEFSVYPERLRKRRIIKADDDAAMYAFLAEREIKRRDYISASYYLRNSICQLAHLLFPLNGQYFVSKRNLLSRINQLNKVPEGFSKLFLSVIFDLKPDETSMKSTLDSIVEMLEDLRKNFDYMKYREEFPVWASKKP